jgi:hypothetical protein
LKLNGQNEVIDRRAMVFTGEKKKKPAEEKPADEKPAEGKAAEDSSSADSDTASPSEDSAAADSPEESSNAADAPPAIEEKPGAGCHLSGSPEPSTLPTLGALGLVLALSLRRRRQRAAT